LCTHFLHCLHNIELFPTPLLQTPHGHLDDSSNGTEPTLQFITLVLPTLTLRPFISSSSFHFPSFSIKLSSDSAIITKSSAYSSSHGNPHPKCCVSASNTMVNSSGLSTEPWCTPTFTSNSSITIKMQSHNRI